MGCRTRAAKSDLLRVVAVDGVIVVDRLGRLPGRGAHVHPDLVCVEQAERRQAFRRALRQAGALDVSPLRAALAAQHEQDGPSGPTGARPTEGGD